MARKPTAEQKAAAQERRARIREMSARFASMTAPERQALLPLGLPATIEGRPLSIHNALLVVSQLGEHASVVGGFRQWRAAGRSVRKGEHGAGIWIPRSKGAEDPRPEDAPADVESTEKPRWLIGYVFDIAQTEPADSQAKGDEQAA